MCGKAVVRPRRRLRSRLSIMLRHVAPSSCILIAAGFALGTALLAALQLIPDLQPGSPLAGSASASRPRVFVADWGELDRPELRACVVERIGTASLTPLLGRVEQTSLLQLGAVRGPGTGLDELLLAKFSASAVRTYTLADADFVFAATPLSAVVNCMRASNAEERMQGVPREQRVYARVAMRFINLLLARITDSPEFLHASKKGYPALVIAHSDYSPELQILLERSPLWPALANTVLRVTTALPPVCGSNPGYFIQAPYSAHIAPAGDSDRDLADLRSTAERPTLAYYGGTCSGSQGVLCAGLREATDARVEETAGSVFPSVPRQPEEHFVSMAQAVFCPLTAPRDRTRPDFFNAVLLGCIPVLSRNGAAAYGRLLAPALRLGSVALMLDTPDGNMDESVADQLRLISKRRIVELQTALATVAPRLRYSKHKDGVGGRDAFAAILSNLNFVMQKSEQFDCSYDRVTEEYDV